MNYATADGTATAGDDYEAVQGTLTFAPGETEKTVSVTVIDDTVEDSGETFRLLLSSPDGATLADSEATGTLLNIEPLDDFPAGTGTTGTVAVDGSATGEIDYANDRDWFAVTLEAGKTYRIDLKGSPTGDGTLSNPYLRGVHDADGNLLAGTTNNNSGFSNRPGGVSPNSQVYFTAGADATYYVAAGAIEHAWARALGTYTLSVTEVPDDFLAGTGTTGTVAVGGSATGEIDYERDQDWFAVTLEVGKTYQIDLKGLLTGHGTVPDAILRGVHDADGNWLAGTANDDGGVGQNSRVIFTAGADATYYVAAGAYTDRKGTYTLSVTDVTDGIPDDYPAGTGTTGTVAVGGSVTGEIETAGDEDWFAVILEADKTYRIDLKGLWTGDVTLHDPYLRGVHDADGNLLAGTTNEDGGVGHNSRVYFTAGADATYYVAAGGAADGEGTYTLSVMDVTYSGPDDFTAGTGTTGTVAVGGSATGKTETESDEDWFAVTLEAGKTYRIDLKGSSTGDGTLYNPYLRGVHDADGNFLAGTTDDQGGVGNNSRVTFAAGADATYYIAAAGDSGYGHGTYRLSVTDVTDSVTDDFTVGTGTTGTVAVGGSATGEIDYERDQDWFAVTLEAGKTYRIDLKGSWTGDGTLGNPYLRGVHDADGNLLAGTTNNNGGAGYNSRVHFTYNSRVHFTAGADATYYVAAGGYERHKGTYTLSVTDVTDDFEAGTGTTGTVAVGGSATGEIEGWDDRDWFAVTLDAGKTYRIDLKGAGTDDGTLWDPYLRGVHDADGNLLAGTTNDNSGADLSSRVYFTAGADATYYVAAGAAGYYSGTYTLSVTEVPDDYPAGTGTTGTVAVGGSATGEIETGGDEDWFAVTLEAGKTYRIDLKWSPTGDGTLYDPYLRGVHDAAGNLLGGTTDDQGGAGHNSRVYFTAGAEATYYVAAGAYEGDKGTYKGTYTLSVTDVTDSVTDDYPAGTGTIGTVAVGGSATGEIDYATDRDWFAVTLEAGKTYRIDLKGAGTDDGTLSDPYLRGVYDADGNRLAGTTNNDGGLWWNSRKTFTASEDGTHYVAAGAYESHKGTYTLSVEEVVDGI